MAVPLYTRGHLQTYNFAVPVANLKLLSTFPLGERRDETWYLRVSDRRDSVRFLRPASPRRGG